MNIIIRITEQTLLNEFLSVPEGVTAALIRDKKSAFETTDLISIALSAIASVPASVIASWIYDRFKNKKSEVKVIIYDESVNIDKIEIEKAILSKNRKQ